MRHGRRAGLSLSAGIMAGSYIWSANGAFSVGASLLAHVWILETVRYCCGGYLIWLAFKSLRSAMVPDAKKISDMQAPRGHFMAGIALHITNCKPILFFGTLFSIGMPPSTSAGELALLVIFIRLKNLLYSSPMPSCSATNGAMARAYPQARRLFACVFPALFRLAGVQTLTMCLTQ